MARLLAAALVLLSLCPLWTAAVAAPPPAEISRPLSLDQAIQLALERNPDVKSAQRALQAAEAARRAALGKLFPLDGTAERAPAGARDERLPERVWSWQ